jgi:acetylxylan esterase
MVKGISAVASAVNAFHTQCPDTKLVLVGYSQGGQIIDNAFCGGPDDTNGYTDSAPAIESSAMEAISAVIEMGSPRFVGGIAYGVGTCTAGGFSARPSGYTCSVCFRFPPMASCWDHNLHQLPTPIDHREIHANDLCQQSSAKMQSYCDSTDPYCCNGSDAATHQGYGTEYGQDALTFIKSKLDSAASSGAATTQASGAANGTTSATDASASGSTASVPITGDGQTTGTDAAAGSSSSAAVPVAGEGQTAGAQTGGDQWGQAQGGNNQWGQAQGQSQGQGQWGSWGKN